MPFDAPARQALISKLLPNRQELTNAIALNSTVMNGARFLGPMLGGLITATFGEVWSFAVNSVMRLAVLFALKATQIAQRDCYPKSRGNGSAVTGGNGICLWFFP